MCDSDVTPVTFYDNVLLPARKLPMPDFSTRHSCRNFSAYLSSPDSLPRESQRDDARVRSSYAKCI